MSSRKKAMMTCFRIIFIIVLQAILYHKTTLEAFLVATFLTAAAFWLVPWLLTEFIFHTFKMQDDFGGTLQFDDSDPTDCRFRFIFNFEPEDLMKEPTFIVKCERTNLMRSNVATETRIK